nr:hypothetical protein [Streptomyces sp. SID4951]
MGGAEAAVIIVIIIVAGVAMVVGLPLTVILQLLAGAGLVAVVTVLLVTSGLGKVLRPVLKTLLA